MSLIGINLTLKEVRGSYVQFARVILYQTAIPIDKLNLENIKISVRTSITQVDVWWASKPYLRIRVDNVSIENLTKMYSLKPFSVEDRALTSSVTFLHIGKNGASMYQTYLIELDSVTGEGFQRSVRNPEIMCDVSSIVVIENMFSSAIMLRK